MVSFLFASVLLFAQETPQVITSPPTLVPLQDRVAQPVELGQVKWGRDFDQGLASAETSQKPALLLFQEVPG